jgi:hypothetical protein
MEAEARRRPPTVVKAVGDGNLQSASSNGQAAGKRTWPSASRKPLQCVGEDFGSEEDGFSDKVVFILVSLNVREIKHEN